MKTDMRILAVAVLGGCIVLTPLAEAAALRRSNAPTPAPSRRAGTNTHVYNPNVSRAPLRTSQNTTINKNTTSRVGTNTHAYNRNVSGAPLRTSRNTTINKNTTSRVGTNTHAYNRKVSRAPLRTPRNTTTATFKGKRFNNIAKNASSRIKAIPYKPTSGNGPGVPGSQKWKGPKYNPFKNYVTVWQTKNWWVHHYNTIVFISGGWYAWDEGYWIPAWGYDPVAVYYYDGPIYAPVAEVDSGQVVADVQSPCGGGSQPVVYPDQVVANVQSALQTQGYYQGEIDGVLGPDTQAALSAYQQAQGLEDTGAVDEPTVESLGLA
ncbi:MAG: hypothetical protein QOJ36_1544 [Verrucomicrobiota bacterium]